MAKSAVIGVLRVNLGLDSAQFSKGLSNAQSRLDKFGAALAKGLAVAAAGAVAALGAVSVGIKRTVDEADKMTKLAQSIGVPVEELTRLKHAADLSGVGIEGLSKGIGRLSRAMTDVASGAGLETLKTFDALGISIKNTDGTLKSSTQIMTEVAEKFAKMEDGAAKTGLAMTLFGRAGAGMIPMLNQGADGLNRMMAEADQLGIVLDQSTGRAAEAFNDNLTRLGKVKDGLYLKITAQLLPAMELLSEAFINISRDGEKVEAIANFIRDAFQFVAVGAARVIGGIAGIRAELSGLAEAGKRLVEGDFAGARDAWNAGQEAAVRIREEMVKATEAIFDGTMISHGQIQRRIDEAFGTSGSSAGEKFVANFETASGGKIKKAIDPMVREAARIFDQTRTPLESYQMEIARLNELLAAGAINQDTYNRAVLQAQDAFDKASKGAENGLKSLQRVGQTVGQTLAGIFEGLFDRTKTFGESIGDVAKRLASMSMSNAFQSLFGSLFGGFKPTKGGFASMLGLKGFAGGGWTGSGPRSGGLDGMGGFPAILHPQETVIDHARGQAAANQNGRVEVEVFVRDDGTLGAIARQAGQEGGAMAVRAYDNPSARVARLTHDIPELKKRTGGKL